LILIIRAEIESLSKHFIIYRPAFFSRAGLFHIHDKAAFIASNNAAKKIYGGEKNKIYYSRCRIAILSAQHPTQTN